MLAAKIEGEHDSSDSSADEGDQKPKDLTQMSRQERKAMDREIPWREILRRSDEEIQSFIEANKKEYASWLSWGSIRPLSDSEIQRVKQDPTLRRRIIPARNAYRDKNRGVPPLKAKCRTVVLGCMDPDMQTLDRTSPTPSRLAEAVVCQIAASGFNKKVQMTGMKWGLWSGDVATAFLQGEPEQRPMPLYMRAPRDGIQQKAQTFLPEIYEVLGNLYGFCNAPRTWSQHVSRTLLEKIGMRRHKLDHMMFYDTDRKGLLTAVVSARR